MFRISLYLSAVVGCHGDAAPPDPGPTLIELREGNSVIATVRPGKPCRATLGPNEMIVGSDPFVSQLGDSRWTGDVTQSGLVIKRDGAMVARFYPLGEASAAGVYDAGGVALVRIEASPDKATVTDAGGRVAHTFVKKSGAIVRDDDSAKVTGTDDVILGALLASPEMGPELRMLSTCERLSRVPRVSEGRP